MALAMNIDDYFFKDITSVNDTIDILPSPTVLAVNNSTSPAKVTVTPQDDDVPPPPGCLLYDDFTAVNSNWKKRSNSWGTSFVNVKFEPSNVWISDGDLHLRAYVGDHTGSEYGTVKSFLYGKYRASIRLDQTPGTYMSIFSYQWPTGPNRQGHNEIDIELTKSDGSTMAIFSNYVNGIKDHNDIILSFDPSAAYHVYGYNWYKDRIEYYVDDMSKPVWVSRKNVPQEPMYLYFQDWTMRNVPEDYGDGVNTEHVDWVIVEPL
jgi:beta-glucanase (GH16 family)